ncbi:MAG: AMP-binding protein [Pseudomonadota bacterium]
MTARWHGVFAPHLAAQPDAMAVSDIAEAWSYADLDKHCRAAEALLRETGVQAGDRVMLVAENCCAGVAILFAASRLGAIAVPVNARQTPREVDRVLDHCSPAAVFYTSSVSEAASDHAARAAARPVSGIFGRMHLATPHPSAPDADSDVAVLLYTTGTTGTPKGVMLTHANLRFGGASSAWIRGLTVHDVIYGGLPMTHVFGLSSMISGALHAGAQVRLETRFSAERLYAALTEGITVLPAVPQMHALLMHHTRERGYDRLPSDTLRYVSSGAAPLDPAWKRKAEAFYGVALQNGYGMTETTAAVSVTCNAIGDPDTSAGPPIPEIEIAIDESGPGGGAGEGEVLTRGPHIMKGYYKNPEATAAVLDAEGWMHTGDIGRIDDQGRLHILGRSKELIIRGGFNVYPPEVEAILTDHPKVIQSAVVGRPVAGDEEVIAFVQISPRDPPDEADLRAFVAARLAGYKRPARFVFAQALPAAPTGKILKHKLLDHFSDQLDG